MKSSSALFKWPKKLEGTYAPSHAHFFSKVKRSKFWDSHFVPHSQKTLITMSLGMTYSPTVSGGGAAIYKLRPVFTYNNRYWQVYSRFQGIFFWFWGWGWGEGVMWEDLYLEKYVMRNRNSMKRAQNFLKLLKKKQWKTKHGKVFSIESKE